jgi:hypothetical protein
LAGRMTVISELDIQDGTAPEVQRQRKDPDA